MRKRAEEEDEPSYTPGARSGRSDRAKVITRGMGFRGWEKAESRARKRSMSNPALNRLLRSGGVNNFHVGRGGAEAVSRRGDPFPVFAGETYSGRFSAKTEDKSEATSHDFAKKENREKGEKRKKDDGASDSDSGDDDGPHFKGSGVPKKGSDGDGDGIKNEKRKAGKKGNGPWDDKDGDGKPNKVDKN